MKREITLPDLKKRLKAMERNDLEKLVYEMYKQNSMVQKLVDIEFLGSKYEERLLEEYDVKLKKIFYPRNIVKTGFSPTAAKKVLKEFLAICKDDGLKAKAKLNFVQYGVDIICEYGGADEKLYDYIIDYFREVVEYASKDKTFLDANNERMLKMVEMSENFGYGFGDEFSYEYASLLEMDEYDSEEDDYDAGRRIFCARVRRTTPILRLIPSST